MAPPDRIRRCSPPRPGSGLSHSVLDLAQIRALVESTTMLGGSICPSCEMPFDKGKKRRLIDSCGHERCYSCLFRSEACPICQDNINDRNRDASNIIQDDIGHYDTGFCSSEPVSMTAIEDWNDDTSAINSLCGSPRPKPKVPSRSIMTRLTNKGQENVTSSSIMGKGLKTKPPFLPDSISSQNRQKSTQMAQSCPTPPTQRRRFFLSTKNLRSPFASQRSRRVISTPEPNDNPSALSAWMTSSWEGKSKWPGVVLGKIKSLWSTSHGTASDGLNQLIDSPTNKNHDRHINTPTKIIEGLNQLSFNKDDEGGNVKQLPIKNRKSSQSDLYMRLGLLLGSNNLRTNASIDTVDLPGSIRPTNTSGICQRIQQQKQQQKQQRNGNETSSYSSLTSFDQQTLASTNTSPVSTLTGTSSEAEVAAALRSPIKNKGKIKLKGKRDCDSAGSLASISTSLSASTSMSMSMSVSVSGLSNGSSSPFTTRKNTTTITANNNSNSNSNGQDNDEFSVKNRKSCGRRSGRNNIKPIDNKLRFISHPVAQLMLKPLFFEVPLIEIDPLFTGRQWLLNEIEQVIKGSSPGILISGSPGTGKSALILQLVEYSCFGRKREKLLRNDIEEADENAIIQEQKQQKLNFELNIKKTNDKLRELSDYIVAYHFCQADNNSTCLVPDLIHSLAAQLCQAPQLASYREYLLSEPHLQGSLSQRECTVDPDLALSRGIIEPMLSLRKSGKLPEVNMVILIDAVCEAEYHRPDRGDTIASFLTRHAQSFPNWLKIICTVRTQLRECTKQFPYTKISLDKIPNDITSNNITRDISDYINYRLTQSPAIQTNVTASINGKESSSGANQTRFSSHLLNLAGGSFLFAKLTLDLIESGHLVAKSASYKVFPVSLAQIFQLHFNLRFPTGSSFDKVQPLLGVCLAALYPLTLPEIFYSVNSLYTDQFVSWEDFLQRFKMLSGFLVKRLDDTYMFFHPSFREWLIRRDESESTKFLCDLRTGHAAIAFRLSRLECPLSGDKVLELGHHVLKAHVYRGVTPVWPSRDLQAWWLTSSTDCMSSAISTLRNIYSPNVKVSRLLLLAGASPNHITEYLGNAPVLCMYAHEGSVEMVSLLLEFGADVELTNSQGCTALSLAASRGHCDVVRRLAAAGASLGHTDMAGQCALVHAARQGRLSVVGYLLACDWTSKSSTTLPTTLPTTSTTSTTIQEQNNNQESINKSETSREEAAQQAVVAAASQGHEEIVEYLLDMSEVIVDKSDTLIGETALTIAAAHGSTATVTALLARGASPFVLNSKGLSPLMLAAKEGHWGTAERLLKSSSLSDDDNNSINLLEQCDTMGRTSLMLASSEGHTNLINLFLENNASIEAIDNEGLTALCWACVRGRISSVQQLLDNGANISTNDKTGRTPLDLAAFQGNPKLVQLLLERGAAIEHVDLHGMRPLDRAIGCRNVSVVQCFLRRGAKLGPATWSMAQGKPDVLIILLNKLLEDGNVLYRKGRLKEASHRYSYALRKFPGKPEQLQDSQSQEQSNIIIHLQTFTQLKINFLLNLSRCKRKMNEYEEAVELADEAIKIRPVSFEAFYARSKARVDMSEYDDALVDVQESLNLVPTSNHQDKRVLHALKDEIISRIEGTGIGSSKTFVDNNCRTRFRASIDTLTEL
ncbi:protein TANC2 isoform X2 [Aphidius gifuensis]|uniref:protein TANC2 isoform X2 n=1 Tax=Aphidius gifuensis TaxID=684658 RepID=UPI001CDC09BB|nr:protein TANC2 isoform X2 [Aphidius gifuensis]